MKVRSFLWSAALLLCLGGPALAHHSQTMFDETQMVTLKGVVSKFAWINPHVKIYVDVTQDGKKQTYEIETNSAVSMRRLGWTRAQFKAGDEVTISFNPVRDGKPEGHLRKLIGPDGKEFSMPGNTLPPAGQKPSQK